MSKEENKLCHDEVLAVKARAAATPVIPPCPLLHHQTAHTKLKCISLADKAPEGVASQNTVEKIEH